MTTETLEKLKSQVLTLSESERAELAHELIQSLDSPSDQDVDEAWDAEILRRLSHIDAGTAKLVSRDEFRQQMRDRIGSK